MKNINRINIYVGEVGSAYIDVANTQKQINAVQKDIQDMSELYTLATSTQTNITTGVTAATNALNGAEEVRTKLENAINELSEDNPKRAALEELLANLTANDLDNNGLNGGSTETAQDNIDNLTNLSTKIQDIIEEIKGYYYKDPETEVESGSLYEELTSLKAQKSSAEATFNELIEDDEDIDNNGTDDVEDDLRKQINAINKNVNTINNIITAIESTSTETDIQIDNILDGEVVPPLVKQYTIKIYILNGHTTGSQEVTVNAGDQHSWEIIPNDGYKMPTQVSNGTINGNVVTSNAAYANLVIYVFCEKIDDTPSTESYNVTLNISNGNIVTGSITQTVNEGGTASWEVEPIEGYKLPTTVTNGTINGSFVTSDVVTSDLEVTVECVQKQSFMVFLEIENGNVLSGSIEQTVMEGEQVTWEVEPIEGYKLPTTITGGTINGSFVTSDVVTSDLDVIVTCVAEGSEPEPIHDTYLYIGTVRPIASNIDTIESNSILFETAKPTWNSNSKGTLNVTNAGSYWLALPVSWGNITIQYGAFPVAQDAIDYDSGERYNNITINGIEHIVRHFNLDEYPYEIWF